jgi:hypothetical protein
MTDQITLFGLFQILKRENNILIKECNGDGRPIDSNTNLLAIEIGERQWETDRSKLFAYCTDHQHENLEKEIEELPSDIPGSLKEYGLTIVASVRGGQQQPQ